MSGDGSRSVQQLTDYEESVIESLREERRRKLGIVAAAPARMAPERMAPERPENAQPGESVLSRLQQSRPAAQPGTVPSTQPELDPQLAQSAPTRFVQPLHEAQPAAVPLRQDLQPVERASMPPAQATPHGGSRLPLTLLGALLVVILAGAAIMLLKSWPTSKGAPVTEAGATAKPGQPVQQNSITIAAKIDETADRTDNGAYEVSGDRIRLRRTPTGAVLGHVRQGTLVRIKERPAESEWCLIQLPGGREGWMWCDFLKPVARPASGSTPP